MTVHAIKHAPDDEAAEERAAKRRLEEAEQHLAGYRQQALEIAGAVEQCEMLIVSAEGQRRGLALDAVSNPSARRSMDKLASEATEARQRVADLRLALERASEKVAEGEFAVQQAKDDLARSRAREQQLAQVAEAERFDYHLAQAQQCYERHQIRAGQLASIPTAGASGAGYAMSGYEAVFGENRIKAALPSFLTRLFPNLILPGNRTSLEDSRTQPMAAAAEDFARVKFWIRRVWETALRRDNSGVSRPEQPRTPAENETPNLAAGKPFCESGGFGKCPPARQLGTCRGQNNDREPARVGPPFLLPAAGSFFD